MAFDASMKQSATPSAHISAGTTDPGPGETAFDEEIVDAELGWMNDVRHFDTH